jgi:hypothetical protein
MSDGFFGSEDSPDEQMGDETRLEGIPHEGWEEFIGHTSGRRWFRGKGGGTIIFHPDSSVKVWWDKKAALASNHSTGNRKNSITRKGEKGMPPDLDDLFNQVGACRRYFQRDGSTCPESPTDPTAKNFRRIFKHLSWRMLKAVGNGNVNELVSISKHLDNFDQLQSGELEIIGKEWESVATAIQQASKESGGIPERSVVTKKFNDNAPKHPNHGDFDLRDRLNRMGFGWLPSLSGKPKKAIKMKSPER